MFDATTFYVQLNQHKLTHSHSYCIWCCQEGVLGNRYRVVRASTVGAGQTRMLNSTRLAEVQLLMKKSREDTKPPIGTAWLNGEVLARSSPH